MDTFTVIRRNDLRPHFYPYGYGRTVYGYVPTPLTLRPSLKGATAQAFAIRNPEATVESRKSSPSFLIVIGEAERESPSIAHMLTRADTDTSPDSVTEIHSGPSLRLALLVSLHLPYCC